MHLIKIDLKRFKIQSDELEKNISKVAKSKFNLHISDKFAKAAINQMQTPMEKLIDMIWNIFSSDDAPKKIKNGSSFVHAINNLYGTQASIVLHLNDIKDYLCFFKNISNAQCYNFENETFSKICASFLRSFTYKIKFIVEKENNDFDSLLAENEVNLYFPEIIFENGASHRPPRGVFITPSILVSYGGNGGVIICIQTLDLNSEELVNIKNITAKYEITRQ